MQNNPLFLFGPRGSGKDTVADHLVKKHGYTRFSFGDRIRKIAKEFGIEGPTKEQLVAITDMGYQMLGQNVWINLAVKDMEKIDGPIVISDMRYPDIYEYFLLERRYFPVGIVSPKKENFKRVIKRDGRFPGGLSKDQSELNSEKFMGYPIFNNSTIERMLREVDEMIEFISDDHERNRLIERYSIQYKFMED